LRPTVRDYSASQYQDELPMMQYLRSFLMGALVLLLEAMLLATVFLKPFDLPWIEFLAGVLFAAVAAKAIQITQARWLVARITKQLQIVKNALAEESARRERAAEELRTAEERFRFVNDALGERIVFVDRSEHCHYHNRAFARWRGRSSDQIDGQPLHEVLGDEIYREIKSHSADVFAGREIRYETEWQQPESAIGSCAVTLLPYPPGAQQPNGFFALIASTAGGAAPAPQAALPAESADEAMTGSHASDEQLIDGKDPRAKLVLALEEDQFILFAQLIKPVAASAPWPRLFEVQLRLKEEERYMAPPGGFIPVAERYNLLVDIDRWVVRNVIKWCMDKQQSDEAWRMPLYCVNVAGASLRDPEFAPYVRDELQRQKFPSRNLCFELREPDVINYYSAAQAFMAALKPLGCRFTLDAFGSTRVSFALLKGLTLDFLKIDGIIIQNLLKDPVELARTRAIALASKKIGVRTIADFVESDNMLSKLREIGVDYAQGFGIGASGPIAQVSS
jgi:EAL domain-containing protein (putative c-di-GMP-specific phosphodiesterase class I)/PAS domain-containing protein